MTCNKGREKFSLYKKCQRVKNICSTYLAERRKITKDSSDNETISQIESVELSQRASITSLQDLKPLVLDSLNTKEKEDVSKVKKKIWL